MMVYSRHEPEEPARPAFTTHADAARVTLAGIREEGVGVYRRCDERGIFYTLWIGTFPYDELRFVEWAGRTAEPTQFRDSDLGVLGIEMALRYAELAAASALHVERRSATPCEAELREMHGK